MDTDGLGTVAFVMSRFMDHERMCGLWIGREPKMYIQKRNKKVTNATTKMEDICLFMMRRRREYATNKICC